MQQQCIMFELLRSRSKLACELYMRWYSQSVAHRYQFTWASLPLFCANDTEATKVGKGRIGGQVIMDMFAYVFVLGESLTNGWQCSSSSDKLIGPFVVWAFSQVSVSSFEFVRRSDLCYRFLFVANIFVCVSSLYVKLREIYGVGLYLEAKLVGLGKRFVCGIFYW